MLWLMMLAASLAAISGGPKPSVGVFIDFDAAPSARSVEEMKKEAAKIMQDAGYLLDWRALRENQGREAFANVVVLKFHGKCRLEYPAVVDGIEEVTLASTEVEDGHVLPYSDVQCDEVRKALPYAKADRQKALGLALGRVVAHELYHVLAQTTRHAAAGLAKASHNWTDLVTGEASFQ